jgi:hypothetical protein
MKTAILICALALSIVPASAQTSAPSTGGMTIGSKAPAPLRFVTMRAGSINSDDLIGAPVRNHQNEDVGEVSDIIIDDGRLVSGIVLSVGGFLGVGTSYVLVDPASVAVRRDGDDYKVVIDASRERLKSAPKFDYPD